MNFDKLSNIKMLKDDVAKSLHEEWQDKYSKKTLSEWQEILVKHMNAESFPNTFVAFEKDKLLGSISLVKNFMSIDNQDTLWVMYLRVLERYRLNNIGTYLLNYAIDYSRRHNYKVIYLFTEEELVDYYRRLDWEVHSTSIFYLNNVTIMRYKII